MIETIISEVPTVQVFIEPNSNDVADSNICKEIKLNPNKFSVLFKKYYWEIWNYVYFHSISYNRGGIERRNAYTDDATMIIFEKAFEKIMLNKKDIFSFRTFLFQHAKWAYLGFYKNYKRDSQMIGVVEEYEENSNDVHIVTHHITPEDEVIQIDFVNRFNTVISWLPESYREPAKLYFVDNYLQHEIADSLNLNQSTVEYRIDYARNFIANKISKTKHIEKRPPKLAFSDQEINFIKENFFTMKMPELHKNILKLRKTPIHIETLRLYCNNTLNLRRGKDSGLCNKYDFTENELVLIRLNLKMKRAKLLEIINENRVVKIPLSGLEYQVKKNYKIKL